MTNNNNKTRSRRGKQNPPRMSLKPKVEAPVASNMSSRQTGVFSQRYRETERILSINGSSDFAIAASVPLNPALATSFPWLSGHGVLFEKYRVHKMLYRYKNLKGTSSSGNVILAFDYDTLDNPPTSAVQLCQSSKWVDGAPWRVFDLKVPTDGRVLFTRSGNVSSSDLKTYDMGRLFIGVEGCADNSAHGYLEVEYDIELMYKQANLQSSQVGLSQYNIVVANPASPGYIVFAPIDNFLGITEAAAGRYKLPSGWYRVIWELGTDTGAPETIQVSVDVNGVLAVPQNAKKIFCGNTSGGNGTALTLSHYVNSDGNTDIGLYMLVNRDVLTPGFNRMYIQKL